MARKKTASSNPRESSSAEAEFHLVGTSPSAVSPTQMRVIPLDTENFYGVVQKVCNSMLIGGYRLSASHTENDDRVVLIFQR